LYNHLLRTAKKDSDFRLLNKEYKKFRKENYLTIKSKAAQNTCRRLINNIKSFYSKKKKDSTSKFPYKFKSWKYFCTFVLDQNHGSGFRFKKNKLELNLDSCKHKLILDLPKIVDKKEINSLTIKTVTFKKDDDREIYYVIFVYSEKPSNEKTLDKENILSIDLGTDKIATCYSNKISSFGIKNKNFKKLKKRKKYIQSLVDNKIKYSKRSNKLIKTKRRICRKISNKNKDFQHKLSKEIVSICIENDIGTLIVGDINTKKLPEVNKTTIADQEGNEIKIKTKYDRGLNESTQNNGTLSRFKTFLEYKSKDVNIDFYKVNEACTSQNNCLTGKREFSSNLSVRKVSITDFVEIDRDLNSAINIAKKIMGKCLVQFDTFLDSLKSYQEMYMNNNSCLCMK